MDRKKALKAGLVVLILLLSIPVAFYVFWAFAGPVREVAYPSCSGFSQVVPVDLWAAGRVFHIDLGNDAGTDIVLESVYVEIYEGNCSSGPVDQEMYPGQTFFVEFGGCDSMPEIGEYRADITIAYVNVNSGIRHESIGTCYGIIGYNAS